MYWQTILQTRITITALPVVWATAAEVDNDPGAPISAAVDSAGGKDQDFGSTTWQVHWPANMDGIQYDNDKLCLTWFSFTRLNAQTLSPHFSHTKSPGTDVLTFYRRSSVPVPLTRTSCNENRLITTNKKNKLYSWKRLI